MLVIGEIMYRVKTGGVSLLLTTCHRTTLYDNMALPIGCLNCLDEPEFANTWIHRYAAQAKAKKLKDTKAKGEKVK